MEVPKSQRKFQLLVVNDALILQYFYEYQAAEISNQKNEDKSHVNLRITCCAELIVISLNVDVFKYL